MSELDDRIKQCGRDIDKLTEYLNELYRLEEEERAKKKYVPKFGDVITLKVSTTGLRFVSKVGDKFVVLDRFGAVVNDEYSLTNRFYELYEFQYNVFDSEHGYDYNK